MANIPPKRNRKGPICFSPHLYRARNHIECFFNRIKQCRHVATRYDKTGIQLPCVRAIGLDQLWLRVSEFTPLTFFSPLKFRRGKSPT
jgi:transposase